MPCYPIVLAVHELYSFDRVHLIHYSTYYVQYVIYIRHTYVNKKYKKISIVILSGW